MDVQITDDYLHSENGGPTQRAATVLFVKAGTLFFKLEREIIRLGKAAGRAPSH